MRKLSLACLLLLLPWLAFAQQQVVNVGSAPNSGAGDPLRTGIIKLNANDSQLFGMFGTGTSLQTTGTASAADLAGTINGLLQPTTAAETAASVTPTSLAWPVLNVLRYGADPTGAVNSTVAFQNAAAVSTHSSTGLGAVDIPCGTYLVNNAQIPGGVTLKGTSKRCVFIRTTDASHPILTWGTGTATFNGGVKDLNFSSASGVTGVAGQMAILVQNDGNFTMQDIVIGNFPAALYDGIKFAGGFELFVTNVTVSGTLHDGITFFQTGDQYVSFSTSFSNGNNGWVLDGAQGDAFVADTTFNNGNFAWYLHTTTGTPTPLNENLKFINIVGDTSGNDNIHIDDCRTCFFVNAWGSSQKSTGVNPTAVGVRIASSSSRNIQFTGGTFNNNNGDGILIDGTVSSPGDLLFTNVASGSSTNGSNGNGRSGTGFGIRTLGTLSTTIPNTWTGGIFDGNASGPVSLATSTDMNFAGSPVGLTLGLASGFAPGAVNQVQVQPSTTGNPVNVSAVGTDANIPLALNAKGTGAIVANQAFFANAGATLSNRLVIGGTVLCSATTPTVSSGGGTSPAITGGSTCAFRVTEGTGAPATALVLTMPTANNGWACQATDETTGAVGQGHQTADTTTSVTMTFGTAPTASDKVIFNCGAF